ncbi:MAG: sugar kinase [Pedobacter sp.]|nr:MAG: sugar kinase [Pedobacter sp.]
MGKILSFGELLLRICPDGDGAWLKENKLPFYIGGAELNVATALAIWGLPSAYLTALPKNLISEQLVGYMDERGVDTSLIQYRGERVGLYYLHKGKDLKNAGVIYDRAHSAYAGLKPGMINWDEIFTDVSWFHFSAICPAISQDVADVCEEALKAASDRNITISVDLNFRAKLWQYGKQPIEVMPALVAYCDVIMGNIWAAEKMLGITLPADIAEIDQKDTYIAQSEQTAKQLMGQFPKCKAVANTFRFDVGPGINYYTTLFAEGACYVSKPFQSAKIVDKVGSGDCFMAGLIYGFYENHNKQELLDFATAAAFGKLFIESDATTQTVDDILKILNEHEN